ncbi:hypothetical protein HYH03_013053 [Edaphochlamys debaryana]|uniref:Uncharacterized protein n=1 Tax=Edaphochlamys debaryana TaxID=47281 RepID=A0A835XSU4_9CHLO|nr:hypothetical protein HYH03_013053 [Edaphochlamys debaryana]|eukprot:KAG2488363.1 hypothetical protein HYH03_013053 [Edaphochlamys debaryana]
MATRHLRKLQEQLDAQKAPVAEPEESEEDSEEEETKAPFNPFDLLSDEERAADEDEEGGSGRDEDAEAEAPAAPAQQPPAQQQAAAGKAKPPAKKATAKKKKQKGKGGKQKDDGDSDDDEKPSTSGKAAGGKGGKEARTVEEDIDAILKELNITTGRGTGAGPSASGSGAGAAAAGSAAGPSGAASVLSVDVKGLRGDEELRRIFGSDVVAAVDRADRAAAAEQRRFGAVTRGAPGGGGGRRRGLALKRGWLVAPKEHWPASEGGLSMELAGHKGGVPLFRYVYSPTYRETQQRFYRCQASYDPATIAALLQQAPYHVDALLAMHDLYRHMGENSYAEEMLDRALWALEAAWHPSFSPAAAACRLDFGVEENKALFGALFRHVQALSRRGCHRAALECCKLLLALEPEDPMGGLYLLDYLAIRAGRCDWLQRFVLQFEGNRSLALLPNYAFALPMAAHRRQAEAGAAGGSDGGELATASPQELLVGALLLHPLVLPRLVAKLQDKGAAKESWWKELLARKLYAGASDGGSASLSHLVGLYVERSGELWKPPPLLGLLRGAAQEAADIADGKAAPSNGIGAADWRALARESFPASAANEYHHLRIADFSDAVNALPREEVEAAVQQGGNMQDVEEAIAQLQEQMLLAQQHEAANGGGGGAAGAANRQMTEEELRGANPLLMLLRSMLPWVNAGQQPDYAADGGAAATAGALAIRDPDLEYDDEDGHLEDEEGVVRNVRRQGRRLLGAPPAWGPQGLSRWAARDGVTGAAGDMEASERRQPGCGGGRARRRLAAALCCVVAAAAMAGLAHARTLPRDVFALIAVWEEVHDRSPEWRGAMDKAAGRSRDLTCGSPVLLAGFDWEGDGWDGVSCRFQWHWPPEVPRVVTNVHLPKRNLNGTLPRALALLSNVTELDFDTNRIVGTLPPEWACLQNLIDLDLNNNLLTGPIPREWDLLKGLVQLKLANNFGLTGCLPPSAPPLERFCGTPFGPPCPSFTDNPTIGTVVRGTRILPGDRCPPYPGGDDALRAGLRCPVVADFRGPLTAFFKRQAGEGGPLPAAAVVRRLPEAAEAGAVVRRLPEAAEEGAVPLAIVGETAAAGAAAAAGEPALATGNGGGLRASLAAAAAAAAAAGRTGIGAAPLLLPMAGLGLEGWAGSGRGPARRQPGCGGGRARRRLAAVLCCVVAAAAMTGLAHARALPRDVFALIAVWEEVHDRSPEWRGAMDKWPVQTCNASGVCDIDPCGQEWEGDGWDGVTCRYQWHWPPEDPRVVTNVHLPKRNLNGTLPRGLALLANVTELDFDTNRLVGTLPPEWGCLTNLIEVDLSNNMMHGTVPKEWNLLKGLVQLKLPNNFGLTGCLPPDAPPLERLCGTPLGPPCPAFTTDPTIGSIIRGTLIPPWDRCPPYPGGDDALRAGLRCPVVADFRGPLTAFFKRQAGEGGPLPAAAVVWRLPTPGEGQTAPLADMEASERKVEGERLRPATGTPAEVGLNRMARASAGSAKMGTAGLAGVAPELRMEGAQPSATATELGVPNGGDAGLGGNGGGSSAGGGVAARGTSASAGGAGGAAAASGPTSK